MVGCMRLLQTLVRRHRTRLERCHRNCYAGGFRLRQSCTTAGDYCQRTKVRPGHTDLISEKEQHTRSRPVSQIRSNVFFASNRSVYALTIMLGAMAKIAHRFHHESSQTSTVCCEGLNKLCVQCRTLPPSPRICDALAPPPGVRA